MSIGNLHMFIGWSAMLLGVVSGATIGLYFYREEWAGGYGSFRRRMLRLGHISFFGLGFINILFGLTAEYVQVPGLHATIASYGFLIGVVTMPLCCFLTAWAQPFRHFFPIPVLSVSAGIVAVLLSWMPA